jgi:hypothetical protein
MAYMVQIRDTKTGEARLCEMDVQWRDNLFWWTGGNFACDCNRGDTFNGGYQTWDDEESRCNPIGGPQRFVVEFFIDPDGNRVEYPGDY